MVHDSGLGTLEDNDIAVNGYSGIEIHSGGNPTVRRNRIHDNKHNGCLVHTDGLGILEDNDIAANGYAGVEIRNGGNPTVRGNRINRNSYTAVWVHNDGRGMIEDNDLTGNKPGPWTIDQDSEANVTRVDNRE
jgi:parallel beta-helix repeat protein